MYLTALNMTSNLSGHWPARVSCVHIRATDAYSKDWCSTGAFPASRHDLNPRFCTSVQLSLRKCISRTITVVYRDDGMRSRRLDQPSAHLDDALHVLCRTGGSGSSGGCSYKLNVHGRLRRARGENGLLGNCKTPSAWTWGHLCRALSFCILHVQYDSTNSRVLVAVPRVPCLLTAKAWLTQGHCSWPPSAAAP